MVHAGRIITAGGITSGIEPGFHLLRRAGYDQAFLADITRVMEYTRAYEMYRDNVEGWPPDDGDAAAARAAGATQAMQPGY